MSAEQSLASKTSRKFLTFSWNTVVRHPLANDLVVETVICDMIFPRWQFNTTTELRNIPPDSVFTDKTHSVAEYVPITEMDYGSLLCWGVNSLGIQTLPCVIPVIPAGKTPLVLLVSLSSVRDISLNIAFYLIQMQLSAISLSRSLSL